jgi:protein-S-isoprenylcysteine O-methyltransferase Ste14
MSAQRWLALALGLILAIYWVRVLRMAIKQRRKTGRGANFLPPEPLGRAIRIVWMPVVAAWVAHPFINASRTIPPSLFALLFDSIIVAIVGIVLAAVALAGSIVCWKRMGKSWRMGIDPNETTPLIVTGPYAYVRHPIYALSSLLMISSVLVIPSPLMTGLALIHLTCLQWEARREEAHLLATHGESYVAYLGRVGRFLPRLSRRARHPEGA